MKIPQLSKTSIIQRMRFSVQVFVVGSILTTTIFLLAVDALKTYTSTVSVLIVPKSQVAATTERQIVANILEIPKTLSFYNHLLKLNPDVRDVANGLTDIKRKNVWNEMLSVEKVNSKGSVINISITTPRQSDSELLSGKIARTLFDVTGKYYNIKTDLDMRIIDGPITNSQIPFWQGLLLFSAIIGFGLAIALKLLMLGNGFEIQEGGKIEEIESYLEQEENLDTNDKSIDGEEKNEIPKKKVWFDFSRFTNFSTFSTSREAGKEALEKLYQNDQVEMPAARDEKFDDVMLDENYLKAFEQDLKIKEMKRLTKQIEPDKYPNFPEMPIHAAPIAAPKNDAKAGAPDNLPIADASVMEMFSAPAPRDLPAQSEKSETLEPQEPVTPKEPTSDELKKRLNELLRGKI